MTYSIPLGQHATQLQAHVGALVRELRPGLANIRSSYALARALDVNQRTVGYIVREARMQGYLVGSSHGKGYYLIDTAEELEATIEHLEMRARGVRITVQAMRREWDRRH